MYNFTYENNGVSTNLVYSLAQEEQIDSVVFGMMSNNKINGLVPMVFTQMDEEKYLKYNISSKVSMEQYWTGSITKERFLKCISSIVMGVMNVEEYMIDTNSLMLDKEYIFVNVSDSDAELVCLPVKDRKQMVDIKMFLKNIIFSTQFDQSENCDYVAKVISFLNSSSFSLVEFKKVLDTLLYGHVAEEKPEEVKQPLPMNASEMVKPQPQMARPQMVQPQMAPMSQSQMAPMPQPQMAPMPQPQMAPMPQPQMPPIPQNMPVSKKGKKEEKRKEPKEKKHLFGKKKENKLQNNNNSIMQGMVIPGKEPGPQPMPQPMPQPIPKAVPPQMPPQSSWQPQRPQPMQQSMVQPSFPKQQGGFGETTVLGGGGIGETTVLGVGGVGQEDARPYLIRMKNNEKIYIDRSVFRIGKEKSYVDYFISDNTAISRSHASILTKGSNYYLCDTNSKNHTFVNGMILQPNIETPIEHGTRIRLANEDFEFYQY